MQCENTFGFIVDCEPLQSSSGIVELLNALLRKKILFTEKPHIEETNQGKEWDPRGEKLI